MWGRAGPSSSGATDRCANAFDEGASRPHRRAPDAGAACGFTLVADSDPAEQLGFLRLELVIGEHAGVSQLAELA